MVIQAVTSWITTNWINNLKDNNVVYITLTFDNKETKYNVLTIDLPRKETNMAKAETDNAPLRLT